MIKKILIINAFAIAALLSPATSFAQNIQNQSANQRIQNIFTISPIIIDTALQKGKKQTFDIQIKNDMDIPLGITADVQNFIDENGNSSSRSKDIIDNSTLSENTFIIPEKADHSITLSINVPQDIKDGGYYETIFITPFFSKPIDSSSPTVLSRAGILFLGTVGNINYSDLKNKVSVTNDSFNLFYEDKPFNYSFEVHNSYFTHFQAKPFLLIQPLLKNPQRIQLEDQNILPGSSKAWSGQLDKYNLSLVNKVTLAVSVGEGNYIYKDFFFFVLPIKEISILFFAILLLATLKFRSKNIKKAVKILIKGK